MQEEYRVLPSPAFRAGEIRALIAGVKTRHTIPVEMAPHLLDPHPELVTAARNARGNWRFVANTRDFRIDVACDAKFKPGDQLWVRETVQLVSRGPGRLRGFVYRADQHPEVKLREVPEGERDLRTPLTATPAHQIPRWASRLVLDVDDVRVERLQDIADDDVFAEGIEKLDKGMTPEETTARQRKPWANNEGWGSDDENSHSQHGWDNPRMVFADLWESRHGRGAWAANPWVETFRFRVRHENVDGIRDALRKGAA